MLNIRYYKEGTYALDESLRAIVTLDTSNGQSRIHMSVSRPDRLPTWDEMKFAREKILPMNRDFIMFFPKAEDYVNIHAFCLHITELKPNDRLNNFIDRKVE